MTDILNKINNFFKAKTWSGAAWLLTLCIALMLIASTYIWIHNRYKLGKEYVTLDTKQMQSLNNLISLYPDDTTANMHIDSIKAKRENRDSLIISYLQSEYSENLDPSQKKELMNLLPNYSNKDVGNYLTDKKIIIKSYFWLTGGNVFLEAWLWSLIGVLVSLVYYVSIAYSKSLNIAGNADTGDFDPAEIPGQIAKMFYAPACTIIIVLSYHFLSDKGSNMIDISVNKGLIVFSFISGFFSGRMMKFLDRLKDLLLPISDNSPASSDTSAVKKTDASVQLKLSDALSQSPEATGIIETGFNSAVVTLTPESGGEEIKLVNPEDDQADTFMCKQIASGKYVLKASMSYKKDDDTIINMAGQQNIEVTTDNNSFTLALDKTQAGG